jgi:hypothetical protein
MESLATKPGVMHDFGNPGVPHALGVLGARWIPYVLEDV